MAARRDAALIGVISIAAAALCVRFDLSEALLGWTRPHERLQLDELPAILLVIALCLIWFAARRYAEARRQLRLRTAAEAQLAEALAQNQRLAQQYLDMQEIERKALARDLHDELGQYLNVIKLDAVFIRDVWSGDDPESAARAARAIIEGVDRVSAVVSNLIRQLRPAGLDELGFAAALDHCLNDWRARLPGAVIQCSIDDRFEPLDESRSLALYRLVQESLTNVARHAQATRVDVRVVRTIHEAEEAIEVSIVDNGRGMDLSAPRAGLGLVGMRERIAAFGGTLRVSSGPGSGVMIHAVLPLR